MLFFLFSFVSIVYFLILDIFLFCVFSLYFLIFYFFTFYILIFLTNSILFQYIYDIKSSYNNSEILIAILSIKGSGEHAEIRKLTRAFAARIHNVLCGCR